MKKFEGMLFCTDLDGTLYTDAKKVSGQNLEAIEYWKSEGGLFTFITGRVPQTAREVYDIIKPNAPYGCGNGVGIYDPVQEKYLWKQYLPDTILELLRAVDENLPEMGIQLNTEKTVYFNKDNEAMKGFRAGTGLPDIQCHYEEVQEPVLKVVFAHREEAQMKALMELLHQHPKADCFDFIRSERLLYEILPKGSSKGTALVKMAELLGISLKKTIAVGDYNNDVSMIKTAGMGFAMENAVEEAKAAADYITVNNNEHAIAAIIDGIENGEYDILCNEWRAKR